ncbi:MAG: diguanylate cyclase [Pseudomonadota bacterium]
MTQSGITLLLLGLVALVAAASWSRVRRQVQRNARKAVRRAAQVSPQPDAPAETTTLLASLGVLTSGALLVIVPTIPASAPSALFWCKAIEIGAFATLFPLLLIAIRRYTLVEIPQWRSVRAFVIGASLLVGMSQIGAGLPNARSHLGLSLVGLPAYAVIGYLLAVLASCIAAWRLVSTPRQRWILLHLALIPLALAVADGLTRTLGLRYLGQPLISWAVLGSALSLSLLRSRQLTIRPIARSAVIDQVQDLLLVADAHQHIVDFNTALAEHLREPKLLGRSCRGLLPDSLVDGLASGGSLCQVLPWTRGEQEFWFEVHLTPLFVAETNTGTLVTLRDITRRRRAEAALEASRSALEAANTRLEQMAHTDPLTGLANRRSLMERLELEASRHTRSGLALGVLLIDLDHFKSVNDQHGHPVGDQVLYRIGEALREVCRDTDATARLGGEEFAVVAVDSSDDGPALLAERLRQRIATLRIPVDDVVELRVTASFGVVVHRGGTVAPDTLLKLADDALYAAKSAGRNRVVVERYLAASASLTKTD